MDLIRLKNFRCFRDEQEAHLAPLTLLVGDNSTGKTSFMAMIRALCDVACEDKIPDFKEDPYDLGSFDDIVHSQGPRGGRADTFEARFDAKSELPPTHSFRFSVVFGKNREGGSAPTLARRYLAHGDFWVEENLEKVGFHELRVGTSNGSWKCIEKLGRSMLGPPHFRMWPLEVVLTLHLQKYHEDNGTRWFTPLKGSPEITEQDLKEIDIFMDQIHPLLRVRTPYASAPVRSKPRRTYDPARTISDSEGDYIPMYLANMYFQDEDHWSSLKEALESFGRASGLFDEINIKQLGKRGNDPFQLQIRKFGGRLKGPPRNMIDFGYGVSQVLPVITELLRPDAPSMFLLQQPEIHLHPRAQAALGSLFCQIANSNRQLIVETHSDYLIDRVRMDVRDGRIRPDDVSILYFERNELDVRIHSLSFDKEGNLPDKPEGYRRFFMEETKRSLGL